MRRPCCRQAYAALCAAILLALVAHALPATAAGTAFTIAVIPDTQSYVRIDASYSRAQTFRRQTEWIRNNIGAERIAFVTHEGDLVQNGAQYGEEWRRAGEAMDLLDGVVPYGVVIGNRDFDTPNRFWGSTNSYLQHFGPQRYAGRPWFGGASPNGRNTYQFFSAGGWRFLHLALDYEVPDAAIAWAQTILDQHPGRATIITTHAYQSDSSEGRSASARYSNNGDQIWNKLIRRNPQIFMVLNGHFCEVDGERHQVSTNDAGKKVIEIVANYQNYPNGGNGWLRLLRFEPAYNRVRVQTYSPTLGRYLVDGDSAFSVSLDFDQRFGAPTQADATMEPQQIIPTVMAAP